MNDAQIKEADGWISELRIALEVGPCSRQLRALNELFRIVREAHRDDGPVVSRVEVAIEPVLSPEITKQALLFDNAYWE